MFLKQYGNLTLGAFFMLLSVLYYFLARDLPPSQVMKIGPSFVPKIVAGITFCISGLLIVLSLTKRKTTAPAMEKDENEYSRVLLTVAAFGAYVVLFDRLGFVAATFLYLMAQMPIMAPREKFNFPLFALVSAVAACAVYYLFKFHLSVMLPAGIIPW